MKIRRRFLMLMIIFLACGAYFQPSLAQENLSGVVKRVKPSTVVILTYNKEGKGLAQGSGFFVSAEGDVITNIHVLKGASRAEVKTAEGQVYSINRVVGDDKDGDLIRVAVDIPPGVVHPLAVSRSLPEVGERVIVIGSPLGLEQTVSDGIISAIREIPRFGKIIQITAPVSPGSSGSPVVNMKGEVIGVATFGMVEGQNLNFAVPSEKVASIGKGRSLGEWGAGTAEEVSASAEALYSEGLNFLRAEEYGKALSCFEEAAKKNPHDAEACFQIGVCKVALGRSLEATNAYRQAILINPNFHDAHYNLGVIYGRLERYQDAIDSYRQATRISPDDAASYIGIGLALDKLKRHLEAAAAYKQAIRINPDDAKAHYFLGLCYLSGGFGDPNDEYEILRRLDLDLARKLHSQFYK